MAQRCIAENSRSSHQQNTRTVTTSMESSLIFFCNFFLTYLYLAGGIRWCNRALQNIRRFRLLNMPTPVKINFCLLLNKSQNITRLSEVSIIIFLVLVANQIAARWRIKTVPPDLSPIVRFLPTGLEVRSALYSWTDIYTWSMQSEEKKSPSEIAVEYYNGNREPKIY